VFFASKTGFTQWVIPIPVDVVRVPDPRPTVPVSTSRVYPHISNINVTDTHTHTDSHDAIASAALTHCVGRQKLKKNVVLCGRTPLKMRACIRS